MTEKESIARTHEQHTRELDLINSHEASLINEQNKTLTDAWIAARAEMAAPKFDAVNPHYHSKFASLAELLRVAIPALAAQGIGLTQRTEIRNDTVIVISELLWPQGKNSADGESLRAEFPAIPGKTDSPQALGSAVTYARRYSLAALLAIAAEDDDDGEAATETPTNTAAKWTLGMAKAKIGEAQAHSHLANIDAKYADTWSATFNSQELKELREHHRAKTTDLMQNTLT
jgi:hypothetical protein